MAGNGETDNSGGPGVGLDIIIPTRDRPAQLAACLEALGRQSFRGFGLIIVDDGSRTPVGHQSRSVARCARSIGVVRNEKSIGPAASRNVGFAASRAPYVVFLDDDCIAHPELIAHHYATLARATGPIVSLGPILAPLGRRYAPWTHWDADRLEREYARMARGESAPGWTHLYTGNVGVRRVDFAAVSGFDERFTRQEDIELGCRLARFGCHFAFDPRAVVWHDSSRSLHSWCQIPIKSAQFDVLIDQLVPSSGRLAAVRAGMREKHWALRLARRTLGPAAVVEQGAVAAAIGAGCMLHAVRADRASLAAFSLVWDLRYSRSLARALSDPPGHECTSSTVGR